MSRRAFLVLLVLAAVTPRTARAEDSDHDRAARAFSAARSSIDAGNCKAAIPKLLESISFEPPTAREARVAITPTIGASNLGLTAVGRW